MNLRKRKPRPSLKLQTIRTEKWQDECTTFKDWRFINTIRSECPPAIRSLIIGGPLEKDVVQWNPYTVDVIYEFSNPEFRNEILMIGKAIDGPWKGQYVLSHREQH